MSTSWKSLTIAAAIAAGTSPLAYAQQQATSPAPAKAEAVLDEEEAFDESLREFGYWSGAAFACVGAEKQADVERKVLDTFNGIARLFGTDRAFFYASAFGNGTTHKVDAAKCPEFLEKFEKATAPRGGRK
jgi:hypothetical protein